MDMTLQSHHKDFMMASCDPSHGLYMTNCVMYRGKVLPREVNAGIAIIKRTKSVRWVDWGPTGYKCGINYELPVCVPDGDLAPTNRAVCMVANNTAISEVLARVRGKFDRLFNKRAYVHWYV